MQSRYAGRLQEKDTHGKIEFRMGIGNLTAPKSNTM